MEIKRSGWVYRMAYPKWWNSGYQPDRPSLCSLFWRLLAMILMVRLIVLPMFQVAGFLFSNKVNFSDSRNTYVPYERWPEIRGHRVWPITVLALAGIINGLLSHSEIAAFVGLIVVVIIALIGVSVAITFLIVDGIPAVRKNEVVRVAVEYVKAKKQKVCPLVKVVD